MHYHPALIVILGLDILQSSSVIQMEQILLLSQCDLLSLASMLQVSTDPYQRQPQFCELEPIRVLKNQNNNTKCSLSQSDECRRQARQALPD